MTIDKEKISKIMNEVKAIEKINENHLSFQRED